jgi:hypothetical protein
LQLYIFRSYIIIINGQRLGPVLSEALIWAQTWHTLCFVVYAYFALCCVMGSQQLSPQFHLQYLSNLLIFFSLNYITMCHDLSKIIQLTKFKKIMIKKWGWNWFGKIIVTTRPQILACP